MNTKLTTIALLFALTLSLGAAPVAFDEVSLLVRMHESDSFITQQLTQRRLLRALTPQQEATIKAQGASDALLQALRNPNIRLSDSEATAFDIRREQQKIAVQERIQQEALAAQAAATRAAAQAAAQAAALTAATQSAAEQAAETAGLSSPTTAKVFKQYPAPARRPAAPTDYEVPTRFPTYTPPIASSPRYVPSSSTVQRIGNFAYDSNGGVTQRIGNFVYHPDSTVTQKIGNFYYNSGGTTTQRIGNFYYNSGGTTTQRIGNFYYHSDGSTSQVIGNTIYNNR